ncbi:hypothetical protein [Hymenobacter coccineus]|uniref:hypothetical protein n=1 Tax=Hymenobacter coccineus TaxID=1908235 RepID=UPI0013017505|nr:hypothetical protein [Hymenobacter coccineus]
MKLDKKCAAFAKAARKYRANIATTNWPGQWNQLFSAGYYLGGRRNLFSNYG